MKILSGGQTGADLGGLYAAQELGLPTGGYVPDGWRTEDGPRPALACYGLEALAGASDYRARTERNVYCADLVLVFGDPDSPGSRFTLNAAAIYGRPCAVLRWRGGGVERGARKLRAWLTARLGADPTSWPAELLVAGNRESRNPGIQEATRELLRRALADQLRPVTVVGHRSMAPDDGAGVLITRPGPFGNPVVPATAPSTSCRWCGKTMAHTRAGAIACHRRYFWHRLETDPAWRANVALLRGKTLLCVCSPMACHGDVIAGWLNGAVRPPGLSSAEVPAGSRTAAAAHPELAAPEIQSFADLAKPRLL